MDVLRALAVLGLLAAAPPEEETEAQKSADIHVDPNRPAYIPDPALAERFARMRASRPAARPVRAEEAIAPELRFEVTGVLRSVEDGRVVISTPILAEMEAAMIQNGAKKVVAREQIQNNSIFEGELYRTFALAGEHLDEELLRKLTGEQVIVEVVRTPALHLHATGIRRKR